MGDSALSPSDAACLVGCYCFLGAIGANLVGFEPLVGAGVGLAAGTWRLALGDIELLGRDEPADPLEAAHEAYVAGEIDELELEQRVELAVDPNADRLREWLEDIHGVGDETSRKVALRFGTVDAVREADDDELEAVHGVGEVTREQIREHAR